MRKLILGAIGLVFGFSVMAQEDLLDMLESEQVPEKSFTEATFKGTRLINGHSVETRNKGVLDFIISHRFGTLNSGAYNLFGLDDASIRLGLEYAITDQLYVGMGRSSYEKTYDAFIKYRLLRQSTGPQSFPLSATLFSSVANKTLKTNRDLTIVQRLAYTNQVLLARKFNQRISIQLMPTFVHYNFVDFPPPNAEGSILTQDDLNNNIFALGAGGRFMITKRFGFTAEYYYQFQKIHEQEGNGQIENAIAIGIDLETGGHVFQLQFTNATAMFDKGFIGETTNDFFGGDIHFGFNISRTFQLTK